MSDQVFWRSTSQKSVDRAVDRRAQNVHDQLAGSGPGRPGGRPSRELCSLDPAPVDWAVDRWRNGQKSDRWAVDRQQDFLLSYPQRLVFGAYLYGAILGCC